jgi:hypothetical protein
VRLRLKPTRKPQMSVRGESSPGVQPRPIPADTVIEPLVIRILPNNSAATGERLLALAAQPIPAAVSIGPPAGEQ